MTAHTPTHPPRNKTGEPYRRVFEIGMSYGQPVYTLGWRMGSSFVAYRVFAECPRGGITAWLQTGTLENVG